MCIPIGRSNSHGFCHLIFSQTSGLLREERGKINEDALRHRQTEEEG